MENRRWTALSFAVNQGHTDIVKVFILIYLLSQDCNLKWMKIEAVELEKICISL